MDSKIVKINKGKKALKNSSIVALVFLLVSSSFTICLADSSNVLTKNVHSKSMVLIADDWWDSNWKYRKEITINHDKIPSDLTNFPVLINIVDDDLATKAQSDGDDIVFVDSDSNQLNHEIEKYIDTNGTLISWINVTSLSNSVDTSIYMYYGNPDSGNQEQVSGVWAADFEAVWHLAETSGGTNAWTDSTGNGYDGTDVDMNESENGTDFDATGMIDGAVELDGSNDNINTSLYPSNVSRTVEFWAKFDTLTGDSTVGCHDLANHRFYAGLRASNAFFGVGDTASADVPVNATIETWYYICVAVNGSTASYFLNGEKITSFSYSQSGDSTVSFTLGYTHGNQHGYINGILDEVRVSYTDRSEGWISTCFNNQNDSDSFYQLGMEEEEVIENHPPEKPQSPEPEDDETDVDLNPTLSVLVTDVDDDSMNVYFYDASDDSLIGMDNNVANGSRAEVQWSNLDYNTTYFWYVVANDSMFENYSIVWSFTTENEQTEPPTVSIIKPQTHRFYFRNKRLFRRVMPTSFIIGHITIKAEAHDDQGIDRVEFYIDNNLEGVISVPEDPSTYIWRYNPRAILFNHRHKITVYAFDTEGNFDSDTLNVFIINFPLLHPLRG